MSVSSIETNQWAVMRSLARSDRADVHDDDELLWVVTGVPAPPFNGVLRATLPPDRADAAIDAAVAELDRRAVPWSWVVGPASSPPDLAERLMARGFEQFEELTGMEARLDGDAPGIPGDLRFERVRDEPSLEAFTTLTSLAFGMPPAVAEPFLGVLDALSQDTLLRQYVALRDGEPVACGSLAVEDGVAGIYNVGVPPERQRQGLGRAMTAALMAEGRAAGAETAVLWSTAAGERVYRALGFEARFPLRAFSHSL